MRVLSYLYWFFSFLILIFTFFSSLLGAGDSGKAITAHVVVGVLYALTTIFAAHEAGIAKQERGFWSVLLVASPVLILAALLGIDAFIVRF